MPLCSIHLLLNFLFLTKVQLFQFIGIVHTREGSHLHTHSPGTPLTLVLGLRYNTAKVSCFALAIRNLLRMRSVQLLMSRSSCLFNSSSIHVFLLFVRVPRWFDLDGDTFESISTAHVTSWGIISGHSHPSETFVVSTVTKLVIISTLHFILALNMMVMSVSMEYFVLVITVIDDIHVTMEMRMVHTMIISCGPNSCVFHLFVRINNSNVIDYMKIRLRPIFNVVKSLGCIVSWILLVDVR